MDNMFIVCTICAVVSLFVGIVTIVLLVANLKKLEEVHYTLLNVRSGVDAVSCRVRDNRDELYAIDELVTRIANCLEKQGADLDGDEELAEYLNNYNVETEKEDADEEPIHLITGMDYHFDRSSDHCCYELAYHESDGTLEFQPNWPPDSKPFIIANVEECVGDALRYFGINSNEPDVVYVRNHIFKADFKITKVQ